MSNSANWKKQKVQLRRGTAAEWTARNTLLLAGEQGYETDTGRQKIGDGVTRWNQLSYWAAGAVAPDDPRFTDAREWTAETISQAEAEGGTSTSRRAFTALRVFQAAAAWWAGSSAKTKLDGIASGATANASDADLRDRATHTGTQAISTVSGLQTALDNTVQSVAGRTGAVFLYAADITPNPTDADNLATGTVAYARLPVGSTASTVCAGDDARLSNARTPTSHVHGNIQNNGTVGTTANLPLITGTDGIVQAGAFGTATNTFCQGDDSRLSDTRTPTDGSVTTAKIVDANVTYAKIQDVSATDRLLGRSSAGAGVVQEITCTAFGRSLIDDADAAAARGTLGVPALTGSNFTGQVSFTRNPSDTSLTQAIFVDCDYATTSSAQRFNFGINIDARKAVSAGVTDTGYILGLSIDAYHEGDGDLTQAIAYRCSTGKRVASTGTVAQAYGVWSRVLNLGTGVITDGYGVYISDVQATNGWGIYQEAANDNNYFRGNVGIGASRTTPGTALDVNGVITVAATAGSAGSYLPSVCISGDPNTGFGQVSGQSDTASIFTAGSERVRVDSSGRVGIGSTAPDVTLHVVGSTKLIGPITEGRVVGGNTGTAQTIALTNGTLQDYTLTGNCTFTMPAAAGGQSFTLMLRTGAGSFTATFTSVRWPGGVTPTVTATASRMDIFAFVSDGTNWYGSLSQNYTV